MDKNEYFPASSTHIGRDTIAVDLSQIDKFEKVERRYHLDGYIASGGQGEIAVAIDKNLQRYIAVKSLHRDLLDDEGIVSSFISEAKITAQLDHPSIIPLYDIMGDEENGIHISMKLVEGGGTIQQLLNKRIFFCKSKAKNKRQKEETILREHIGYFIKICEAVGYAHSQGVVHCDIKPENIMVGSFHDVYVMDWGLAEVWKNIPEDITPSVAGTPRYIAPEIINGDRISPVNDIYALGMILYEIVTLNWANEGDGQDEIYKNTVAGNLRPIKHRFSSYVIHPDLKAIIRKAAAINPKNRYRSVEDLASDLRSFERNDQVMARPDNIPRYIARKLYKHRIISTSIVIITMLSLLALSGFSLLKQEKIESEAKTKELRHINFQIKLETQAHEIDRKLLGLGFSLKSFAKDLLLWRHNKPLVDRSALGFFNKNSKFVRRLYAGFEDGQYIRYPKTGELNLNFNHLLRPWYLLAKTTDKVVWTRPYIDAVTNVPVISASKNIRNLNGKFIGVASLDISLSYALSLISSPDKNVHGRYIVSSKGEILLETHSGSKLQQYISNNKKLLNYLNSKNSGQFNMGKNRVVFAHITSLDLYIVEVIND